MRTRLEQQLLDTMRRTRMIVPGDRVVVAVSGGADSVALFRTLMRLREALGISILIAHFNHKLRGAESESDEQFVAALAREHCVELILDCEDVASAAKQQRLNLEDAARRLRYAFFHRIAEQGRATRIAVAHTADDQAETVLARLFRGTGMVGLAAAHPIAGPVIRPFLDFRREELRRYLGGLGQPWREDSTNFDLRRQRARIRAELLPVLARDFSSSIVKHLCELARFSLEERGFWNAIVEDRFRAHARERGVNFEIRIQDLLSPLPVSGPGFDADTTGTSPNSHSQRPLTERLIRRLYGSVRGGDCRDLTSQHVEQVIRLASESASGRRVELPGHIVVERNFDHLAFLPKSGCTDKTKETCRLGRAYQYVVEVPSHGVAAVSIPELGSRLLLKVIDWSCGERETKQADALDADLLRSPLTLRSWRPGDAYRPRGHRRVRKLKQLFLRNHVPRSERLCWPVLESARGIVWARGMPSSGDFCVRNDTRTGIVIEEASL